MVRVLIELEFEHLEPEEVSQADVINYLHELIDNDMIGFDVLDT